MAPSRKTAIDVPSPVAVSISIKSLLAAETPNSRPVWSKAKA